MGKSPDPQPPEDTAADATRAPGSSGDADAGDPTVDHTPGSDGLEPTFVAHPGDSTEAPGRAAPESEPPLTEPAADDAGIAGDDEGTAAFHLSTTDIVPEVVRRSDEVKRYRVLGELARGGMGVVHRVWDENLDRSLAMKVIRGQEEINDSAVTPVDTDTYLRFLREARITGQLDHPGVVPIHEIGTDEFNRTYFTMRLVEGDNLHRIFRRVRDPESPWTQTRVLDVMVRVCETLAFAHSRNIIHRDLKPDNVMVGRFGETYVMDWGLAKQMHEDELPGSDRDTGAGSAADGQSAHPSYFGGGGQTMAGSVLGTPAYMPPEQAAGRIGELDNRSDIFSVGTMLYELLTGVRPYGEHDPPLRGIPLLNAVIAGPPSPIVEHSPQCPVELVAVAEKAMARSKEDRYETVEEMGEDLRAYLENRVVRAYQSGPWAELRKWVVRNRGLAVASLVALVVAVGGLAGVIGIQRLKNDELEVEYGKTRRALTQEAAARAKETEALAKETEARTLAQEQRRRAEALYLARRSAEALTADPGLALLIAREACARHDDLTTRTALYAAAGAISEIHTISTHLGEVWRCEFSPDGTRLLTGSDDGTAAIFDVASREQVALLIAHVGEVRCVAWSPDGQRVATGGAFDHRATVWDANTGERIALLSGHSGRVWSASFSQDARRLATASSDGSVRIWDTITGEQLSSYSTGVAARCVRFSPDGKWLAFGRTDGTVGIVEVATGNERTVRHEAGGADIVRFSDSGERLMSCDRIGPGTSVCVWSCPDAQQIVALDHENSVTAGDLSGDGSLVATGTRDGTVRLWDADTGALRETWTLPGPVKSLDLTEDGKRLAACTGTEVRVWRVGTAEPIAVLRGHRKNVLRVRFDPTGGRLVSCGEDQTARLWALHGGHLVPQLHTAAAGFQTGSVTPDGHAVVRGIPDTVVYRWAPDGSVVQHQHPTNVRLALVSDGGTIVTLDENQVLRGWSADGTVLWSVDSVPENAIVQLADAGESVCVNDLEERTVRVLETNTGAQRATHTLPAEGRLVRTRDAYVWILHTEAAPTVRVIDVRSDAVPLLGHDEKHRSWTDGEWLVTGAESGEQTLRLWSVESGQLSCELAGSAVGVMNVRLSPRGTRVLADQSGARVLHLWDRASGTRIARLGGHASSNIGVRCSPDEQRMVSLCGGIARLWDLRDGALVAVLSGYASSVQDAVFSPDSSRVALAHPGPGLITVWNASTGELETELATNSTALPLIRFSPDSQHLLAGTQDGRFRRWDLSVSRLLELRPPRTLTSQELTSLSEVFAPDEFRQSLRPLLLSRPLAALREVRRQQGRSEIELPIVPYVRKAVSEVIAAAQSDDDGLRQTDFTEVAAVVAEMPHPDTETLASLARLHAHRGDLGAAVRLMERVCGLAPAVADHDTLLEEFRDQADGPLSFSAIDERTAAGETEPTPETGVLNRYHRAVSLLRRERPQEALTLLEDLVQETDGAVEPLVRLADAYRQLEDYENEETTLRRAVTTVPCGFEIWHRWAVVCLSDLALTPDAVVRRLPTVPREQRAVWGRDPAEELRIALQRLAAGTPVRVNCGGPALTDANGNRWDADGLFTSGLRHREFFGHALPHNAPVSGTETPGLFASERVFDARRPGRPHGYRIPVPPGQWSVTLSFVEMHFTTAGKRTFAVTLEGETVLESFDPAVDGHHAAIERTFTTTCTDGSLDLLFNGQRDFPQISALEVRPVVD